MEILSFSPGINRQPEEPTKAYKAGVVKQDKA